MTNPDREELVKIADLRSANVARQQEWDAGNKLTLAYRGNELAGEVGEACNVIKKLERERLGIAGSRDTVAHLAEELADVVICADLIAMHEGIDLLGEAVPAKFNATSEKVGLKTRLCTAPPADAGMREAFRAGWYVNAVEAGDGEDQQPASYLANCEQVDWEEYVKALTAPGATTKSDGGVESRYAAACAQPRGVEPEVAPGPSDPSSTRSEVTVLTKRLEQVLKVMRGARNRSEPMAVWADDIKAVEDAIALFDQFEIRRK